MKTFKEFLKEQEDHPMIDVDGEMRPRNNSEGNPIHHTDEGIRNFHRWFGDSEATDEHGRPQVHYHGSNTPDIREFRPVSSSVNTTTLGDIPTTRHGIFFSDNKHFAKEYGKYVNSYYLKTENPHNINRDTKHELADTIDPYKNRDTYLQAKHSQHDWSLHEGDAGKHFVEHMKNTGHDSTKFGEDVDDKEGNNIEGNTTVVFHPNQIKSATSNSGSFSTKSNKVTE
jgi:hypothetical protein